MNASMRRHSQVKTPWRIVYYLLGIAWHSANLTFCFAILAFTRAEDRALRGRTSSADPAAGIQRVRAQLAPASPGILAIKR